jgi:hypothetical protein
MSERPTRPIFVLRLTSIGGHDIHKLRRLLKVLLRAYGWRCLSAEVERERPR